MMTPMLPTYSCTGQHHMLMQQKPGHWMQGYARGAVDCITSCWRTQRTLNNHSFSGRQHFAAATCKGQIEPLLEKHICSLH